MGKKKSSNLRFLPLFRALVQVPRQPHVWMFQSWIEISCICVSFDWFLHPKSTLLGFCEFPVSCLGLKLGSKESCFPLQFSKHVSFTKLPLKHLLRSLSDFLLFLWALQCIFFHALLLKDLFRSSTDFLCESFRFFFFGYLLSTPSPHSISW